jgi:hypothetical protein
MVRLSRTVQQLLVSQFCAGSYRTPMVDCQLYLLYSKSTLMFIYVWLDCDQPRI